MDPPGRWHPRSLRFASSPNPAGWQCEKLLWWKVHEAGAPAAGVFVAVDMLLDSDRSLDLVGVDPVPGGIAVVPVSPRVRQQR